MKVDRYIYSREHKGTRVKDRDLTVKYKPDVLHRQGGKTGQTGGLSGYPRKKITITRQNSSVSFLLRNASQASQATAEKGGSTAKGKGRIPGSQAQGETLKSED